MTAKAVAILVTYSVFFKAFTVKSQTFGFFTIASGFFFLGYNGILFYHLATFYLSFFPALFIF